MEIWRVGYGDKRPEVLNANLIAVALCLHVGFFILFWLYAALHGLFKPKAEEVIPIDLTVIINENLNGVDNEPPPLKNPEPPPPPEPPKPKPKPKEPEKPKELEKIVTNIVAKVEKKEEKKPEKPKEPDKPKKTKEQLRQEKIARMQKSATVVGPKVVTEIRTAKESGNGRTERQPLSQAEIQRRLDMGYKPGTSNQDAKNAEQLGFSLIKAAFEEKWDTPPWTDTLRPMKIRVWFANGGRIVRYNLEASSGDAKADQSIQSAASRVGAVPALPPEFIDRHRASGVPIKFTVKPE